MSGSGSSGGGIDINNLANNFHDLHSFANTIANVAINRGTFGILGYDNGSISSKSGALTHFLGTSIGAVDGANAQHDVAQKTSDQLNAADAAQAKQVTDTQTKNMQNDIQASQGAAGIRATANAQRSALYGASINTGSSDQRDFLGL